MYGKKEQQTDAEGELLEGWTCEEFPTFTQDSERCNQLDINGKMNQMKRQAYIYMGTYTKLVMIEI